MQIGIAKIDITPTKPLDLCGYGNRFSPSQGIHDRLFARTLLVECRKNTAVLLTADLIAFTDYIVKKVRKKIQEKYGIPGKNIMLACSHTHSGPVTGDYTYLGRPDKKYIESLINKLVHVTGQAKKNLQPATIGIGKGTAKLGINRRHKTPQGMSLGVNTKGPVDHEVTVMRIDNRKGKLIGIMFNYACHGVVLGPDNLLISGDYPGEAEQSIEKKLKTIALFTNGACGDINPCLRGKFQKVKQAGTILAKEVLRIVPKIRTKSVDHLKVNTSFVSLPFKKLPSIQKAQKLYQENKKELEKAKQRKPGESGLVFYRKNLDWSKRIFNSVADARQGARKNKKLKDVRAEIQIIRVGPVVLVGIPGEVFVELGRQIKNKRTLKSAATVVIGYANGCVGYIPTKKAFREGGYEPASSCIYYGYLSTFKPGIGEKILQKIFANL